MFRGFQLEYLDVGEVRLRVRHGGSGPPVVLLHGHPRTHTTWHIVAPALAEQFTVVCPDLRGYGQSSKPALLPDHSQMSKRALAADIAGLMTALGHERFAVVGHDRGAYVAYRTALDHASRVTRLVVMDGIPISEALRRADARFARAWWHWFFYGQTTNPAEHFINADPDAWYGGDPGSMGAENYEDFRAAVHDPATVRAMLEDYRAGLTVDATADEADRRTGRRTKCPILFLWATKDDMVQLYGDPLAIWRRWADNVEGRPIESGHHMPEEAGSALADELREFLSRS